MFDKSDIWDYAYMAKTDRKAYKKLIAETNKILKEANRRIIELEKAGVTTPAEKYIKHQITLIRSPRAKRFARFALSKEPSIKDIRDIGMYAAGFLERKTSTLEGYKESIEKRNKVLSERYGISIQDADSFREYLKSDYFKVLRHFDSDTAMQFGLDNIENTDDLDIMEEIYKDWREKKIATADLFNNKVWASYEGNHYKR